MGINEVKRATQISEENSLTVWTVGHSTRALEEFISLLQQNGITCLVDVRSFPGSRRHPQFGSSLLRESLGAVDIEYHHLPSLGGRRKPVPHSRNTAWRNVMFQAYADHMESAEFKEGINNLLSLAQVQPTAIMCAEALWWRCHRSLISDYLRVHGVRVVHILDAGKNEVHPYTSAARIVAGELSYAGLLDGS